MLHGEVTLTGVFKKKNAENGGVSKTLLGLGLDANTQALFLLLHLPSGSCSRQGCGPVAGSGKPLQFMICE